MGIKQAAYLGIALVCLMVTFQIYKAGGAAAIDKIEDENNEVIQDADEADLSRRDCNATDGMHWDFGAAKCVRSK